ncbi:MAG: hypothetical protein R3263_05100 [Myxococcota bacterium]|nr:hypothetical protein [Myxococcota bacterium]
MAAERRRGLLAGALLAAALVGLAVLALVRAGSPPQGPVEVPLDAATCARCRMLVSDPSFAAQLHTEDGEVRFFDDPGCLLLHLDERAPDVHAAWVHHLREARWVPLDRARFVAVPRSPMGHGLGAVGPEEAPEGITAEEALARLRRREEARRAPGGAGRAHPAPGEAP